MAQNSTQRRNGRGGRFTPRRPDTALSAECRRRVAEVIRAHDDPAVSVAEFYPMAVELGEWLLPRPDPERLEACIQIHEMATRHLTGKPNLVAIGWMGLP